MNETLQDTKLNGFRSHLNKSTLAINASILSKAESVLEGLDFPTTRNEDWKYTRVGKIASISANSDKSNPITTWEKHSVAKDAIVVVLQNGQLIHSNFNPSTNGLLVKPLSDCSSEELSQLGGILELENSIFNSLNTVYATNGVLIKIPADLNVETPIEIIHIVTGDNQVSNIRNLFIAERFSKSSINQIYVSENANNCFVNAVTEIFVQENASFTINKLQNEEEGNYAVVNEQIAQDKDSFFQINTMTLNGSLIRNNIRALVNGVNCTTNLYGAYVLKNNQHVDNHTVIDHKAPHCLSNELYKGVMDDKSTGVFNGKVFVRKDSQKINAFQSNGNVLLSDNATINSKPELEIYADDVKCSHGSTTGQLDEEAVFYLRARGLSEKSARNLMVSAFIGDVLGHIHEETFLNKTQDILKERFGWDLED